MGKRCRLKHCGCALVLAAVLLICGGCMDNKGITDTLAPVEEESKNIEEHTPQPVKDEMPALQKNTPQPVEDEIPGINERTPQPAKSEMPNIKERTPKPAKPEGLFAPEGKKRVGAEHYGFWNIPEDWLEFRDVSVPSELGLMQYSDPVGANIISVYFFMDTGMSPEELLVNQADGMESMGGNDVTCAMGKLSGIDVLQVYCTFVDRTVMVEYAFMSDDGVLHLIIAEGPVETIFDTIGYLELSYALER